MRDHIVGVLNTYLDDHYQGVRSWLAIWLAGSGISYQWAGDRGNGDLDVLFGIDFAKFYETNPTFQGISEMEFSGLLNTDLKKSLWPRTANTDFHGQTYEVTYYLNPGTTSLSIEAIHPYAAYNLTYDRWDIRPPELPTDPREAYPHEWWSAVEDEKDQARALVSRYNTLRSQSANYHPNSAAWKNTLGSQRIVIEQAKALFDDIHLSRHKAFSAFGKGYGDYYNFRWQAHKESGTVQALNTLAQMDTEARKEEQTELYGAPLDDAATALAKAALWNTPYRR
ncbi:hypothetical protein PV336_16140 [Streptomyces sp. MI02-2A]|uniref:hypothetical protein n=1 Tax=Streptomyces sp. MI02-2A TaxID=3028688 RepID=UPI0029B4E237|nr:hypothetical protein [Streptomyces sp. MI02-2A]MDX3260751.1 hypothetical protein [Streptomyces sp. MI02-2A]